VDQEARALASRRIDVDPAAEVGGFVADHVHADAAPGQGSRFLIPLPLTLAITQAVLVRAGTRHYAIPSSMVAQVRELKPETVAAVRAEGATIDEGIA
jgi:chemosensory pili system protein ChpA (sensor histidine kinase/response regulator)